MRERLGIRESSGEGSKKDGRGVDRLPPLLKGGSAETL